jgi:HEAT repeat protein
LRTSGEEGEELLIKIVKYHKNYKVRMAAASVLSYRLPSNARKIEVDLRLDGNEVVQLDAIPPG